MLRAPSTFPLLIDDLKARYAARAEEAARLGARVDGGAVFREFVEALERLAPASAPARNRTAVAPDPSAADPAPPPESAAARSRLAFREVLRHERHIERVQGSDSDTPRTPFDGPVARPSTNGYDPSADARQFAVSLRAKKGGTR